MLHGTDRFRATLMASVRVRQGGAATVCTRRPGMALLDPGRRAILDPATAGAAASSAQPVRGADILRVEVPAWR